MIAAGNTLDEARAFARRLSLEKRGSYVTLFACFGIFAQVDKRLHVHAPTDSIGGSYWLNGTERAFTDSQQVADEQATPTLY